MMVRRRPLTESNSDVVTMYFGLFGRMRAISFCAASMRSGVGGCVENTLGIVPGRPLASAWMRPKKVTKALGAYPALVIIYKPRKSASRPELALNFKYVSGMAQFR